MSEEYENDEYSTSSLKIKKHTKFDDDMKEKATDAEASVATPCIQFDGVESVAKTFIDKLLNTSVDNASLHIIPEIVEEETTSTSQSAITFVEFFGSFTSWPTIAEFSVELGEDRITEYLSTWYYEEEWLYCVELILQQSDGCCDYFIYETKWSLPTKEYPIAQATASIYFTVAVSRVKPPYCTVDVTYNYEGCRYVHIPFKHTFTEQWLFNIIEAKLKFFRTLRF